MNFGNNSQKDDNMDPLARISGDLKGIKFEKRTHFGLVADAKTTTNPDIKNAQDLYDWHKKENGYCILGRWQFIYTKGNKKISCIRSGVSFGMYEIFAVKGFKMEDPERFQTAVGTIARIKELLN